MLMYPPPTHVAVIVSRPTHSGSARPASISSVSDYSLSGARFEANTPTRKTATYMTAMERIPAQNTSCMERRIPK